MKTQKLYIKNKDGLKLSCLMDIPDTKPIAYAIFAHCFTCSKNIKAAYHISHTLARNKIACLRFDFTGIGESEGDLEYSRYSSDVNDIIDVTNYINDNFNPPSILVGHSLGGTAVLKAAGEIDSIKAVVTIGSPFKPSHIIKLIDDYALDDYEKNKIIKLGDTLYRIKPGFLDDLYNSDISDEIANLKKALLIMHSPVDDIVSIDNAMEIFAHAKHPKSFISLDSSDHLISNKDYSIYAGNIISVWALKYINKIEDLSNNRHKENNIVVQTYRDGLKTDIFAGRHHLIADEPASVGGSDKGPNPYDYLLASLGSCTSMTVMMYAKRKGWDISSVKVSLSHTKIHARDSEKFESKTGKVDSIEREIQFLGTLNEEQINRLAEIADKCPVHRTLHSKIVVKTSIIE